MPGSTTTPGRPGTRDHAPVHLAFRLRNDVSARDNLFEAQWLAYALPYRRFASALTGDDARLGVDVVRYSFIVSDLHQLLLAGLPAHCERFWTLPSRKPRLRFDFDRRLKLEFHGSKITFDAGLLVYRELDEVLGLTELGGAASSDLRRGENTRHLLTSLLCQSVCYHPLFCFNQFGDLERSLLRSGNVHSPEDWRVVMEPVVKRYRERQLRRYFRADAAFAKPEFDAFLETEGYARAPEA
jgi:hypothetical protein